MDATALSDDAYAIRIIGRTTDAQNHTESINSALNRRKRIMESGFRCGRLGEFQVPSDANHGGLDMELGHATEVLGQQLITMSKT